MKWTKLKSTVVTDDVEGDDDEFLEEVVEDDVAVKTGKCCAKTKGPSLVRTLLLTYKGPILAAAFFKFLQDSLSFVGPVILR